MLINILFTVRVSFFWVFFVEYPTVILLVDLPKFANKFSGVIDIWIFFINAYIEISTQLGIIKNWHIIWRNHFLGFVKYFILRVTKLLNLFEMLLIVIQLWKDSSLFNIVEHVSWKVSNWIVNYAGLKQIWLLKDRR